MKKIIQKHAPEDHQVDSAPLLDLTEDIFLNIKMSSESSHAKKWSKRTAEASRMPEILSTVKELGMTVHHMSCEMLQHSAADQRSDAIANAVLELLEKHRWSTKLAIVLAALASNYGKYWLIAQLCLTNPLAFSLAAIKGMSDSTKFTIMLKHRSKALRYLLEKMVSVTKCVMEFEILPLQYVTLDYEAMAMMKTQIHIASYWVIRSSVACASQITSMIASRFEIAKAIPAAWELWSLVQKISYIYAGLSTKFDAFNQQIESKVYLRLLNLFEEVHVDNHDVLYTLFALKDDFPLRDSFSQKKVGVDVLKNKMEDGKIICLYGSNDLGWVRELTKRMKDISEAGIRVELIYVGSKNFEQTTCRVQGCDLVMQLNLILLQERSIPC
ncbi:hypothetical protein OPV22_019568 [Ensete ventricosum]|uniref:Sieve element occlusion N-terminal domain-containing protein n=1 Tax=Ensete ventricosum TaxID=4639 RepID=A0AAV8QBS8_ENSVE|nr:hypothetical protein OPV22_019568 [Ensete ventricosum]